MGADSEQAVPSALHAWQARSGRVPDDQCPGAVVRDPRLVAGLGLLHGTQSFFLEGEPPKRGIEEGGSTSLEEFWP